MAGNLIIGRLHSLVFITFRTKTRASTPACLQATEVAASPVEEIEGNARSQTKAFSRGRPFSSVCQYLSEASSS